jgi:hypothetical protein
MVSRPDEVAIGAVAVTLRARLREADPLTDMERGMNARMALSHYAVTNSQVETSERRR